MAHWSVKVYDAADGSERETIRGLTTVQTHTVMGIFDREGVQAQAMKYDDDGSFVHDEGWSVNWNRRARVPIRFWRNSSGTTHLVADFREADAPAYEYVVETACGLEYMAETAGETFDALKPGDEQATYPEARFRCGNCRWPEAMD